MVYRTDCFKGRNPDPVWNYSKVHTVECMNDYILDYFKTNNIVFKTYGSPETNAKITEAPQPVAAAAPA